MNFILSGAEYGGASVNIDSAEIGTVFEVEGLAYIVSTLPFNKGPLTFPGQAVYLGLYADYLAAQEAIALANAPIEAEDEENA